MVFSNESHTKLCTPDSKIQLSFA